MNSVGQKGVLGYEIFLTTNGKDLFITEVDVASQANQGQAIFQKKLEASEAGQTWNVDAEFSTGQLVATAQEKQVILNTPPRPEQAIAGLYPKSVFTYNATDNTYTCPHQQTLAQASENKQTGDRVYRPAKGVCADCPLHDRCTTRPSARSAAPNMRSKWPGIANMPKRRRP